MAVDYTKLFTCLGKPVKHANLVDGFIADLTIHQEDIEDQLDLANVEVEVDDLPDVVDNMQDDVTSWITGPLKTVSDHMLMDPVLLVNELTFSSAPSVRTVLEKLFDQMITDAYYVSPQGTVATGVLSVSTANTVALTGLGIVTGSSLLDGIATPEIDIPAFRSWNNKASQLARDLTIKARCTADSESGGVPRGSETFQLEGGVNNGFYNRFSEGAGQVQINLSNNQSLIPAGKFDSWSSGLPTGWTIVGGVTGVDFQQSVNGLRGTSCLQILNAGGNSEFRISISPALLTRAKSFALYGISKRAGAITVGAATLSLNDDTGLLASTTLAINSVDWTATGVYLSIPNSIAGTPYIKLAITSPDNDFFLDDLCLVPPIFFNGLPTVLIALDNKILNGDTATLLEGYLTRKLWSEFLRKQYRFQLPVTGSTLIAESLAQ